LDENIYRIRVEDEEERVNRPWEIDNKSDKKLNLMNVMEFEIRKSVEDE